MNCNDKLYNYSRIRSCKIELNIIRLNIITLWKVDEIVPKSDIFSRGNLSKLGDSFFFFKKRKILVRETVQKKKKVKCYLLHALRIFYYYSKVSLYIVLASHQNILKGSVFRNNAIPLGFIYSRRLFLTFSNMTEVHGKSTDEWHTNDIRAHTSDIRMTYEYIRVTYEWHTSRYEWHTNAIRAHTINIRVHMSDIRMTCEWHADCFD